MPAKHKRTAFTLTEVLLAIGLMAIIAVLLATGWSRVRRSYSRSLDTHRMNQIWAGWYLYVQENNQKLPPSVIPATFKTIAKKYSYIDSDGDWSNDSADPKNSIFSARANVGAIKKLFTSGWDDRPQPDPLNSFSHNTYLGIDGRLSEPPEGSVSVHRWSDIRSPERKIFLIPSWFLPKTYSTQRFSGATTGNPFRNPNNPARKGHFPALFVDGHIAFVDPAPNLTLNQINRRWLEPGVDE